MSIEKVKVVSMSDKYVVGQKYFLGIPCGYIRGINNYLGDVDIKIGQWAYIDDYFNEVVGVENEERGER